MLQDTIGDFTEGRDLAISTSGSRCTTLGWPALPLREVLIQTGGWLVCAILCQDNRCSHWDLAVVVSPPRQLMQPPQQLLQAPRFFTLPVSK